MSTTDELRELLDKRGVEWRDGFCKKSTMFDGAHGVRYEVDGTLGKLFIRSVLPINPEQAIAATLGDDEIDKLKAENEQLRGERESLVSSLNRAEDRWSTLRDRLEGLIETWRRLEGRDPDGVSYALEFMREIVEQERTERS